MEANGHMVVRRSLAVRPVCSCHISDDDEHSPPNLGKYTVTALVGKTERRTETISTKPVHARNHKPGDNVAVQTCAYSEDGWKLLKGSGDPQITQNSSSRDGGNGNYVGYNPKSNNSLVALGLSDQLTGIGNE